jgi:16S rRNA (cytosine1402-N4)-methyltransferase
MEEVMAWLALRPEGIYVDATAGAGGHARRIAEQLKAPGRLIALDRDPVAVQLAQEQLADFPCAMVVQAEYAAMAAVLSTLKVESLDGVLIDAGVSSMQLDTAARGFSFQQEGPLDMRMNPESGRSAAAWIAASDEQEIARVLRDYGDVRPAARIARVMAARARAGRMATTMDLVAAVHEALPFVKGMPDEVRTVFQAVRIAVNDELGGLERGLRAAAGLLRPGGRLVVISFHSAEDRVVKETLRALARPERRLLPSGREEVTRPALLEVLTRKPVLPSTEEMKRNPRSKSAKLRAAARRDSEGAQG